MSDKAQIYSVPVIDAVAECLRTFYWYKNDLRSFLLRAAIPQQIVGQLNWDGLKRDIARSLLDGISRDPSKKIMLDKLIEALVEQNERFPHLARQDDGPRMVQDAYSALTTLKGLLGKQSVVDRAERAKREHRTESARTEDVVRQRQATLSGLNARFMALFASNDPHKRGYDFQTLLRDLFALYDLEPSGSFAMPGQQTDGAIKLDGTVMLLEARRKADLTPPAENREFRSKVHEKLDGTLGLFVSMSGFTDEAIQAASGGGSRMVVILADGSDFAPVFSGQLDLLEVLRRKHRRAAERGIALHRVGEP